jgi:hypothetical protein
MDFLEHPAVTDVVVCRTVVEEVREGGRCVSAPRGGGGLHCTSTRVCVCVVGGGGGGAGCCWHKRSVTCQGCRPYL